MRGLPPQRGARSNAEASTPTRGSLKCGGFHPEGGAGPARNWRDS